MSNSNDPGSAAQRCLFPSGESSNTKQMRYHPSLGSVLTNQGNHIFGGVKSGNQHNTTITINSGQLVDVIYSKIADYLDYPSLLNYGCVSKSFHIITREVLARKTITFRSTADICRFHSELLSTSDEDGLQDSALGVGSKTENFTGFCCDISEVLVINVWWRHCWNVNLPFDAKARALLTGTSVFPKLCKVQLSTDTLPVRTQAWGAKPTWWIAMFHHGNWSQRIQEMTAYGVASTVVVQCTSALWPLKSTIEHDGTGISLITHILDFQMRNPANLPELDSQGREKEPACYDILGNASSIRDDFFMTGGGEGARAEVPMRSKVSGRSAAYWLAEALSVSLFAQDSPQGWRWGKCKLQVSGCTATQYLYLQRAIQTNSLLCDLDLTTSWTEMPRSEPQELQGMSMAGRVLQDLTKATKSRLMSLCLGDRSRVDN